MCIGKGVARSDKPKEVNQIWFSIPHFASSLVSSCSSQMFTNTKTFGFTKHTLLINCIRIVIFSDFLSLLVECLQLKLIFCECVRKALEFY